MMRASASKAPPRNAEYVWSIWYKGAAGRSRPAAPALANLTANALRYGAPDSAVTIDSAPREGGVELGVHNAGPAFAPEHLQHLFERFYRCDPSRHAAGDSGGLGLAIVQSIMQLHGGTASVASADRGTRFSLRFP